MTRIRMQVVAVLVLTAFAMSLSAYAQEDLFAGVKDREDKPLTEAQKAAGEKEPIFCNSMKVGQVCTHGTAAILGLKGADAEEWTTWARKYNKTVNDATEQLFKDAAAKLSPEQMDLLKAWFAVGWNPEINAILYGKGLDQVGDAASKVPVVVHRTDRTAETASDAAKGTAKP